MSRALAASLILTLTVPFAVPTSASAALPAASGIDDGAGFSSSSVELSLQPADRLVALASAAGDTIHDHGVRLTASAQARLLGSPTVLILEDVPVATHLVLRTRTDGAWSPWLELVATLDEAPDREPVSPRTAIGPVWIGHGVDEVEVGVVQGAAQRLIVVGLEPATAAGAPAAGHTSSTSSTTTSTTTTTVSPEGSGDDTGPGDGTGPETTVADEPAMLPDGDFIRPRSAWATDDMGWACSSGPHRAERLEALVVHHTATASDYAEAEVPGIIRAIWRYHVQTRGWCDIAYNFVVDRFGGIWEARQGGIDQAIVGGHTRGFNTGTVGIAQLANLDSVTPKERLVGATRDLVGWKLGIHGLDPTGTSAVTNRSGGTVKGVEDDGELTIPTVVGHRDLGTTSCPGQHSYVLLPDLRNDSVEAVHLAALHQSFLRSRPAPADHLRWLNIVRGATETDATESDPQTASVAGSSGLDAAAIGMARSEAYSGLIIEDLYQRVLNRSADEDPEGRAYWLDVLASGVRVEKVGVLFYGSEEYFLAKTDGRGTEGYITALYRNLLHREPESDGLGYWVGRMEAGMTPPQVAGEFYASLESRRDRVERLYQRFLGRAPDDAGRAHWSAVLIDTSDVLLAVHLSLSPEFYLRATR